jgi:hypothetical protein
MLASHRTLLTFIFRKRYNLYRLRQNRFSMPAQRILKAAAGSLISASVMTMFSYKLSHIYSRNYREPALLSEIIKNKSKDLSHKQAALIGWFVHYLVGMFWGITCETTVMKRRPVKKNLYKRNSLFIGIATGLISATVWKLLLGRYPKIHRRTDSSFFIQLVPAHILFTIIQKMLMQSFQSLVHCKIKR